jgi:uncharacterized YigZ family protein
LGIDFHGNIPCVDTIEILLIIGRISIIWDCDYSYASVSRTVNREALRAGKAYIIGGGNTVSEFCSDDREPPGTSGKPALAVLRGSGLGDVALVITRYFGGTLLGTGGLVKAYTESAQLVVNAVGRGQRVPVHVAVLAIPYNLLERVRLVVTRGRGEILSEDFGVDVTLTLRLPVDSFIVFQNDLRELSAGKLQAEVIETKEMIVAR